MAARDPIVWWPAIGAAIIQAFAWTAWVATQAPEFLLLAALAQLASGLATTGVMARDRRVLATILAVGVPILGPLAIPQVNATSRGGDDLLADPTASNHPTVDGPGIASQVAASMPPCEAILSDNVDARRATIARLSERADAADITVLRWVRNQRNAEIAIEGAMALEEAGQHYEQRLQSAVDAASTAPSYEHHAAVVRAIYEGIATGIVEPAQFGKLVTDARRHAEAALALESVHPIELAVWLSRIELAVRQPVAALATLKPVIGKSSDPELVQLYISAAYAARRFDLAGIVQPGAYRAAA